MENKKILVAFFSHAGENYFPGGNRYIEKGNTHIAAGFITVVTTVVCLFGGLLGKKFGELLSTKATLAGGLILVAIGLKIFIEHMFM